MRPPPGLGHLATVAVLLTVRVAGQNTVDISALQELPRCTKGCLGSAFAFATYDCTPSQSCFCDNKQLQDNVTACLTTNRCSFADRVAADRFQKVTCRASVRNRGPLLGIVAYVLFGVASVITVARVLARWSKIGGTGLAWDDLAAVICYAPLTLLTVAEYYAVHHGYGKDIGGLTAMDTKNVALWLYVSDTLYTFIIFGTKISLVLLYLRVWSTKSKMRTVCWSTLLMLAAALIAFEVTAVVQCLPIPHLWTQFVDSTSKGSCIRRQTRAWGLVGTDVGFVALVILLPIPALIKLKLSGTKRIGALAILLVGLAVAAMSIARAFNIRGYDSDPNFTYHLSFLGLYSNIEAYLSQICCSLPAVASLVRRTVKTTSPSFSSLESKENVRVSAPTQNIERCDFGAPRSPTMDPEKAEQIKGADDDPEDDIAPAPTIPISQRASHASYQLRQQRSYERPFSKMSSAQQLYRDTYRSSATTARPISKSGNTRAPDILFHDRQNQLKLEIHDEPQEPIKAHLQYVDKTNAVHDLEWQGKPREDLRHTTAPSMPSTHSSSDSSSYSGTSLPSPPTANRDGLRLSRLPPDLLPWATLPKTANLEDGKLQDLANAHKLLTEGISLGL